ncbi:KAP family P-loop NTPase fold protein [Plantibacter sp. Mn2098]|uniref:KAP family P-loop NTPase fold protein n=1 Tax=Plantibacter sp. Mn2098 TaxID=3395266 RepID=UPI003BE7DF2D
MTQLPARRDLNDDPLAGNDDAADHLGRHPFVSSAVSILNAVTASGASSVVALVGAWGSGKSSALNMINSSLRGKNEDAQPDWIIADFNPWFFQDLDTLQAGFFRELSAALPSRGSKVDAVRQSLVTFGKAVAPLTSIATLFGGIDASKSLQALSGFISPDQSLAKTRTKLEDALRDLDQPVLMVLDDLDRLSPDELLLTLKLIRLVERLPRIYYLVAYDEDTLLDSLNRTGLVGADARRGVDYLKKMIQVRLDLSLVRQGQLDRWIDQELPDLQRRLDFALASAARRRLAFTFLGHVRDRLATPRAVQRYFSQVDAFVGSVHTEVDVVDFLVLTWFRTAEPLVCDLLTRDRSALLGEVWNIETADLFGKPDKEESREYWRIRLERPRVSPIHMEGVADMVGLLFPRFKARWTRADLEQSRRDPTAGRVHHPDYFDRYFAFGVPPEDVSDADAATAYPQLRAGEHGTELALIEGKITDDVSNLNLALCKMFHAFENKRTGGVELLRWIAKHRNELPDDDEVLTPNIESRWIAQQIYLLLPADEPAAAMEALAHAESGFSLGSCLISHTNHETERRPSWDRRTVFENAKHQFGSAVQAALSQHDDDDVFDVPDELWPLIWDWQIIDLDGAKSWLRARIDPARWPRLDVVARFVSRQGIMGVSGAPWTLGNLNLNLQIVDRLFGVDAVLHVLGGMCPSRLLKEADRRRLEHNPENRRAVALSSLTHLQLDRDASTTKHGDE